MNAPPISMEDWGALQAFLRQLGDPFGLASGPGLKEDIEQFLFLLFEKNKEVNLTALRDFPTAFWKHIADSLALCQWEPLGDALDWGCGGGLPGIPLALARKAQGIKSSVDFLDSVGKKIRAVEEFSQKLGLIHSRFFYGRGEDLLQKGDLVGTDTVLLRAVAPAEKAVHWLTPGLSRWVLLLGPNQRESWKSQEKRLGKMGFSFGREATYSLPFSHGDRALLEILRK